MYYDTQWLCPVAACRCGQRAQSLLPYLPGTAPVRRNKQALSCFSCWEMQNGESCKPLPQLPWSTLSILSRVYLHHFKSTEPSPWNTADGNATELRLRAALSQSKTDRPCHPHSCRQLYQKDKQQQCRVCLQLVTRGCGHSVRHWAQCLDGTQ